MHVIGEWKGQAVGCFFVLRTDIDPPVPVYTIHRVTDQIAQATAKILAKKFAVRPGYAVKALVSVCDCQGAAVIEP